MKTGYTREERKRICRGWNHVKALASRAADLTTGAMLQDALRLEHRSRGSLLAAKAILLNCLADNPTTQSVAGLFTVSRGCQLAYILAAHWNGKPEWETIRNVVAAAALDYREACRRTCEVH